MLFEKLLDCQPGLLMLPSHIFVALGQAGPAGLRPKAQTPWTGVRARTMEVHGAVLSSPHAALTARPQPP